MYILICVKFKIYKKIKWSEIKHDKFVTKYE